MYGGLESGRYEKGNLSCEQGPRAGSAPTILGHSIDWANNRSAGSGADDFETIASRYGGLLDLWSVSAPRHPRGLLAAAATTLRTLVHLGLALARRQSVPILLVLHSYDVSQVARHGFEQSPFVRKVAADSDNHQRGIKTATKNTDTIQQADTLDIVSSNNNIEMLDGLAICSPDTVVTKYDLILRLQYLMLFDLIALKTRLAEGILRWVAGTPIE
ncbi:unnamed protein product [Sympodiomycopsis kandeliae]